MGDVKCKIYSHLLRREGLRAFIKSYLRREKFLPIFVTYNVGYIEPRDIFIEYIMTFLKSHLYHARYSILTVVETNQNI